MNTIYFIAGASGSGKTAIMPDLKKMLGDAISVYDFDEIGVPDGADKRWRQESTEKWLQKLLKENKDVCLLGQMVLGEILACPSARQLDRVNFCLLDVLDVERIRRLKRRNIYGADQNMLNWAAWLRMHHHDPQWAQHVIKEECWSGLNFEYWDQLDNWYSKANIQYLDTTKLSINEVAECVSDWISEEDVSESIPNSSYKLYKNPKNAYDMIDEKIVFYNKKCVPATQEPEFIKKNYIIKENNKIIGGICADIYMWKILYISLLFIDEAYRNKDLATLLLKRVEDEAKAIGVSLVHLDSFDFQAKDFYLKQGYEIFGTLENCPEGHKRYYLRKNLTAT